MMQLKRIAMRPLVNGFAGCLLITAFATFLVVSSSDDVEAGPTVKVGKNVSPTSQTTMDRIDHSGWNALLNKYVDDNGFVDYRAWHASSQDRKALAAYLNELSRANPGQTDNRDAELAFWINAYNAVTVHGILREYPTTSIRNHTAKLFGYNIWQDLQLIVGGQGYSLEHIEHQILRKTGESRIHFAIVCASVGCPRLLNRAYTVEHVQQQLEVNAKDFFSRTRNFRYDQRNRRFYLSSILSWFADDFGSDQAAQLRTISQWLPSEEARRAALQNVVSVSYLDYDWNLNDTATQGRVAGRR